MTVSDVHVGLRERASTIVMPIPSATTNSAMGRWASRRLRIEAMLGPPAGGGAAAGGLSAGPAPGGGGISFREGIAGAPEESPEINRTERGAVVAPWLSRSRTRERLFT